MIRVLVLPAVLTLSVSLLLSACAQQPITETATTGAPATVPAQPYIAQVVGVQWLNPLQRRDYPTEWQLLWTLGLVKPNKDDDMVRKEPLVFSTLQVISSLAGGRNGVQGYHAQYVGKLIPRFHGKYYSNPHYFYNVATRDDRTNWRELAGIHVEYALPEGKIDVAQAATDLREEMINCFSIGKPFPQTLWTRDIPPDIRVTTGGANAGFTSLTHALDYLQAHPTETAWVMNWDAPSFPPKEDQLNENMVLLVLAGPDFKTERHPLAWIGYPASRSTIEFEAAKGMPARAVQAWHATISDAAANLGKRDTDIGYVIHDAHNTHADSSDRIAHLAQALTSGIPEFDFLKQTFNTPALLGYMGAGTSLTNVALGIAYANHMGKHVLVAGTTDNDHPIAVLIQPPAKARPIDHDDPWFRARGEGSAYLMWWGMRHDAPPHSQGYSY